jgi:hypothetical protein
MWFGPLSLCLWSLHQVTDAVEDLVQAADGEEGGDKRGWWLTADKAADGTKLRPALSTHYVGWEETIRVLVVAIREHGPFDGILGFSQVSELCEVGKKNSISIQKWLPFVCGIHSAAHTVTRGARYGAGSQRHSPHRQRSA